MSGLDVRRYSYRVQWSPEDDEYVATVLEFPTLSWLDQDQAASLEGLVDVVTGVVDDLITAGEEVPQPFTERSYSGTIYVRTSAEVHRRLVMEAAENHVSLNQWAAQRLANAWLGCGDDGRISYYDNGMADETINGVPVTDGMIQEWADEAETGYDVAKLRKRGRPTVGDGPGEVVPVRMDAALLEALNARAEREHVTRSEAIRAAVRAWTQVA